MRISNILHLSTNFFDYAWTVAGILPLPLLTTGGIDLRFAGLLDLIWGSDSSPDKSKSTLEI